MFNFKKIVAGIAVGAMVMGSGVAAFAGNGFVATDGKTVQFAAQYKNGTWAAAPYDMNDANIASAEAIDDGVYELTLKTGEYRDVPMGPTTMNMEGTIVSVTDATGEEVSVDEDGDGYADTVVMEAGASNLYVLKLEASIGSLGHNMTQTVYLMAE